jgi:2-polyprenyl-3-methyl-5-hydroxy-6-metoxy-1,4-benzoquinol methylase
MISNLDKNLEIVKNSIDISDEDIIQIVQNIPASIDVWEYVSHKCMSLRTNKTPWAIRKFVNAYQMIRDESWPTELKSIDEFYNLPEAIQSECRDMHRYHPSIWFDPTIPFDSWIPNLDGYSPGELIRIHYVLYKNYNLIKDKRVIDFPCYYGNYSFFLSNMGFSHLTLAEVRPVTLNIAAESMQLLKVPSTKWSAVQADLHDLAHNIEICQGQDTIICSGVLYHIHDHLDVLESIVKSGIKNIILETEEYLPIKDSTQPLIHWITESTEYWGDGWHNNKEQVLVGYPNTAWLDMAMKYLGCRKTKPTDFYPSWHHDSKIVDYSEPPTQIRSVHVYVNETV